MDLLGGHPDFFGLDLDHSIARIAQLKGHWASPSVFRFGQAFLPNDLLAGDNIPAAAEVLREALAQNQITTRNVVMGLPTSRIFMAVRKFHRDDAQNFERVLRFEKDKIIPAAFKDDKIDYVPLDQDDKEAEEVDVFICSARKDFVENRLDLLEAVNLNVLAFEPNALALVRSIANAETQGAILIINIKSHETDIVCSLRNQPRVIVSELIGVQHILDAMVKDLQFDQEQAQQTLFTIGFDQTQDPGGRVSETIIRVLSNLIAKIKATAEHFLTSYKLPGLDQIILFGDGAYIPQLNAYLQQFFNYPLVFGNAWQNVTCPPAYLDQLNELAGSFALASGLAGRQVFK